MILQLIMFALVTDFNSSLPNTAHCDDITLLNMVAPAFVIWARCTNMTIIEHKECEDAYPGDITDTMGCTSVREEGKDSCQGDSGGPLVYNGSLQGITSWGQDPCAVSRKPRVYTKVCSMWSGSRRLQRTISQDQLVTAQSPAPYLVPWYLFILLIMKPEPGPLCILFWGPS
ncbi:kallikrein-11-like [Globicephala melas]|uniref:kallikrein-11-like n=1 Tax=Globicephala melas TaxID=9731 RepID=UPI00122F4BF2|nr:kallikrein-11-like [Globicephala melas]